MSITSTILVDGLWLTILKEDNNDDLSPPTIPDPNLKDHYHTPHTLPAPNLMEKLNQLNLPSASYFRDLLHKPHPLQAPKLMEQLYQLHPPPALNLVKDSILRP